MTTTTNLDNLKGLKSTNLPPSTISSVSECYFRHNKSPFIINWGKQEDRCYHMAGSWSPGSSMESTTKSNNICVIHTNQCLIYLFHFDQIIGIHLKWILYFILVGLLIYFSLLWSWHDITPITYRMTSEWRLILPWVTRPTRSNYMVELVNNSLTLAPLK